MLIDRRLDGNRAHWHLNPDFEADQFCVLFVRKYYGLVVYLVQMFIGLMQMFIGFMQMFICIKYANYKKNVVH